MDLLLHLFKVFLTALLRIALVTIAWSLRAVGNVLLEISNQLLKLSQ
jgi:hypothetical protein